MNHLQHKGFPVHWLEGEQFQATQKKHHFEFLCSLPLDEDTVVETLQTARWRWKIENEGFNTQKNQGYALTHAYARTSFTAKKNYYQCLQVAHLINQLFEHAERTRRQLKPKETLKHLFKKLRSQMRERHFKKQRLRELLQQKVQMRFTWH